ncbi:hypothetical protein Salat_0323000 [Sesamum alatum]|uniref:TF-B3 domain-containing protein n=1 Tax=Sesamum alatum TaxID=300844 RepID=A0AAE2CZ21_9LAMI|nr:hypothetical protein Salat_0323000 [Sesamum alatum]
MSRFKDLTIADMEGIVITSHNPLDILAATAQRALQLLLQQEEEEEAAQRRQESSNICTRRKRKETCRSTEYEERTGDQSSAKRKKPNNNNTLMNKKKGVMINNDRPEPPRLPERFKNVIEKISQGRVISQETLVIEKALFNTDLCATQNRLSIPFSQISHHGFLTDEETEFLCSRDEKGSKKHKQVTIIEPSLESRTAKFSRWDMEKGKGKTSSSYVINGTWRHIVESNDLRVGMVIQLWAFRIGDDLCFALVNDDPIKYGARTNSC